MLKIKKSEQALISDKGNLLIRTVIKQGIATVTKYAWFTNANKRSECKLLKETTQREWDYLLEKGLLFAEIDKADDLDQEAPVYKEKWSVWMRTSGSPSCWTDWQFEAGGFETEEEAEEMAKHISSLEDVRETEAYEQYGNYWSHSVLVVQDGINPNN